MAAAASRKSNLPNGDADYQTQNRANDIIMPTAAQMRRFPIGWCGGEDCINKSANSIAMTANTLQTLPKQYPEMPERDCAVNKIIEISRPIPTGFCHRQSTGIEAEPESRLKNESAGYGDE